MTTLRTTRAGTREWCALIALCLAVLLVTIDATVLALAIPSLSADLRPSGTQVLWIGDVYSFVLAGLLVPMGALGDRVGRRRLLLVGAAAFGVASALSAYAPTAELLIVARLLLGVAGATIMPSTLSLIRTLFDDARQRTAAIGIWSAVSTAGGVLGPILGGVLLEHFWWGSVFLVNVPVVALFLLVAPALLPEVKAGSTGRFDVLGAALAILGIVSVVYAIKEVAGGGSPWLAAAAGVLGAAVLVVFVRRQRRHPNPVLDVGLFARPALSVSVLVDMVAILALAGLVFFIAQFFQLALGLSALESAVRELPAMVGAVAGGLLAAPLAARAGARAAAVGGLLTAVVGLVVIGIVGAAAYPPLGVGLLLVGAGAGAALTVTAATIVSAVPKEKAGAAAAVSETAYELGTALGIALLGASLTAVYRAGLVVPPGAEAARDSLVQAVELAGRLGPEGAALLAQAQQAFVTAVQVTSWIAALVLAVAAVLAARWMPDDRAVPEPAVTDPASGRSPRSG